MIFFFQTSDEKGEIIKLERKVEELESLNEKLENKIVELEEEKGNLLLSVLDVDDFKGSYQLSFHFYIPGSVH